MPERVTLPLPYPEVNVMLEVLHREIKSVLRQNLLGLYLYGSIALDAFDPDSSDIDFVAVTRREVQGQMLEDLIDMHHRIGGLPIKWALELEGSYISVPVLRHYDPANRPVHPRIERGDSRLSLEQHDTDQFIQRYILRERGVVIEGPPPETLIDPVMPADLRMAMLALIDEWMEPIAQAHMPFPGGEGYRTYLVASMCRILYTLMQGGVLSKMAAVKWTFDVIEPEWHPLLELTMQHRNGTPLLTVDDTRNFMQMMIARCRVMNEGT